MTDQKESIPLVDFGTFSIGDATEINLLDGKVQTTAKSLCDAFRDSGFVYLVNHGLSVQEVDRVHSLFRTFFSLPLDVKKKYLMNEADFTGYVPLETEKVSMEQPHSDLKEGYNLFFRHTKLWPNEHVPGFQEIFTDFYLRASKLAHRVLQAMAIGLNLQDPLNFFCERHNVLDANIDNLSAVKAVRYPPPADGKPGQIGCGEHTDFGSITLIFQDGVGGLEVQGSDEKYHLAPPIPGSVVVNIGELMQRWTADQLKAMKHRVAIQESAKQQTRYSIIFFMTPNADCLVECLDGSNKYPPITVGEWMKSRMGAIY